MIRIYTNLLSIALFLVLVPTAPASTTWYVNGVNGNDTNTCKAPQTACKTIGHAISLAASGDSIIVAAATYTENLTIGLSLNVIGSCASGTIIDGKATGRVISINANAQVTLSNVTIRNGLAPAGGGIYNAGRLTINSSTISGNSAFSRFQGNGGGILNYGNGSTLTINNSTISGNTAGCGFACAGAGGAISNYSTLRINNSTLNGNSAFGHFASAHGGAIYTAGSTLISNSTISGNSASLFSQGAGIYGTAALQNSIVANNIVANNVAGNCSGNVISNGYNLSSDSTCNFVNRGDLDDTDPRLGPLQNNGGPTLTQALLSGSPAIDTGNPIGCTDDQGRLLKTDQRGQPRPDKEDTTGCDRGAFEGQSD